MGDIERTAADGGGASAGRLPKRLVRREMPASRKERLRQAYAEAAADAGFQAEMAEIDRAFDVTVGDGLAND